MYKTSPARDRRRGDRSTRLGRVCGQRIGRPARACGEGNGHLCPAQRLHGRRLSGRAVPERITALGAVRHQRGRRDPGEYGPGRDDRHQERPGGRRTGAESCPCRFEDLRCVGPEHDSGRRARADPPAGEDHHPLRMRQPGVRPDHSTRTSGASSRRTRSAERRWPCTRSSCTTRASRRCSAPTPAPRATCPACSAESRRRS